MPISSHRPFKAKPVQRICQASPSNRERTESQPDWRPERPKSLSDLRETTQKVEIWVGARGWPGPNPAKIWKIAGWRSRAIGLLRPNPFQGSVRSRRVNAKGPNLSPIGGRRGQNLLAPLGKLPKKSVLGNDTRVQSWQAGWLGSWLVGTQAGWGSGFWNPWTLEGNYSVLGPYY